MENKIYNLLYNIYSESLEQNIPQLPYQLFVMSMRSLIPYENKIGCEFNVERYKKEFMTLRYYINGQDSIIQNMFKTKKPTVIEDEKILYKILPIAISNTIWENTLNEVLKFVVFYTFNKKSLLDACIMTSIIFEYMSKDKIEEEALYETTKERLIGFSIKHFYQDNFNTEVKSNYAINFEKERIAYIIKSSIKDMCDNINSLNIYNYVVGGQSSKYNVLPENDSMLKNFAMYLNKIRKGILDPSKLKTTQEDIKLENYIKHDTFIHPILGKCHVLSRQGTQTIIKTKTGNIKVNI